jgi:hypothetical protein
MNAICELNSHGDHQFSARAVIGHGGRERIREQRHGGRVKKMEKERGAKVKARALTSSLSSTRTNDAWPMMFVSVKVLVSIVSNELEVLT